MPQAMLLNHDLPPHMDMRSTHDAPPLMRQVPLQAANYLNIKPLLDLTCLTVANMIKGGERDVLLGDSSSKPVWTKQRLCSPC